MRDFDETTNDGGVVYEPVLETPTGGELAADAETNEIKPSGKLRLKNDNGISWRNLIMFPLGTFGRDFLYNFFANYLLSFILFTKHLDAAQFSLISIIIIAARVFDAFNDPIMGGVVENTRSKWGKYKPWQFIGSVLTGAVIITIFCVDINGWAFIGFFAAMYFLFSITFTMNDISYWGMMPSLTSNENGRNKLTSFSNLVASAGGGLVGLLIPALTAGNLALPGGAVTGYKIIAIVAAVLMVGFQLFTIFGVKEKALPANILKEKRMGIRQMFRVIAKNDQLLWCTIVLLIFCVGSNVVAGGLSMTYIYFEFGYQGGLLTLFGIGYAITSTAFVLFYPWLSKRFGRNRMLYSTAFAMIFGYLLMMVFGLAIPSSPWILKFVMMAIAYAIVGYGNGFYMIMVVNMANTVEYNEFKTGKREEGLIFSLRPFTAKMGSALMQGVVMLVYLAAGVLTYTNRISDLENSQAMGSITETIKLEEIGTIIGQITVESRTILLVCMCLIPAVFMTVAVLIYKKKCFLSEKVLADMIAQTKERADAETAENADMSQETNASENADSIEIVDRAKSSDTEDAWYDHGNISDDESEAAADILDNE